MVSLLPISFSPSISSLYSLSSLNTTHSFMFYLTSFLNWIPTLSEVFYLQKTNMILFSLFLFMDFLQILHFRLNIGSFLLLSKNNKKYSFLCRLSTQQFWIIKNIWQCANEPKNAGPPPSPASKNDKSSTHIEAVKKLITRMLVLQKQFKVLKNLKSEGKNV